MKGTEAETRGTRDDGNRSNKGEGIEGTQTLGNRSE